jgi:hypothetical protein
MAGYDLVAIAASADPSLPTKAEEEALTALLRRANQIQTDANVSDTESVRRLEAALAALDGESGVSNAPALAAPAAIADRDGDVPAAQLAGAFRAGQLAVSNDGIIVSRREVELADAVRQLQLQLADSRDNGVIDVVEVPQSVAAAEDWGKEWRTRANAAETALDSLKRDLQGGRGRVSRDELVSRVDGEIRGLGAKPTQNPPEPPAPTRVRPRGRALGS